MKVKNLIIPACLSASMLMAGACTPVQPALNQTDGTVASNQTTAQVQTADPNAPKRFVRFQVEPPTAEFSLKQTAQANFIKLTAVKGNQTIFDSNADAQGFIQVVNPNATFSLGANIPDGNNWVVTVGFYSNKTSAPILELKNAFHVPLTGTVTVNMQTFLTGAIVEELNKLGSAFLNNALDLNAYQSFVNGLTGAVVNSGTLSFPRLTALNPPTPQALATRDLAIAINLGSIANVTNGVGAGLDPANYQKTPYPIARYSTVGGSYGIDQNISIDAFSGKAYFSEVQDGDGAAERLYAITTATTADGSTGFKKYTEEFAALNTKQIIVPNIVLGRSNPTGGATKESLFYLEQELTPGDPVVPKKGHIRAKDRSNGQEIWTYTFPFSVDNYGSADSIKAPLLTWRDPGTGCACRAEDQVFVYVSAGNSTGIYGIKQERPGGVGTAGTTNGTKMWEYILPQTDIMGGGAVARDGSKLYFVTNHSSAGKLIVINRTDGTLVQSVNLGNGSRSGPAIGTDGTVYVIVYDASPGDGVSASQLKAFNPDGTAKWTVALPNIAFLNSPVVDRQNGKDVIYLISSDSSSTIKSSHLYAYIDEGTSASAKWTPANIQLNTTASNTVFADLLIGAEPDGSRIIYTGLKNSKLYAVRDTGTKPQIEWENSAGGNLWNGLTLRNGTLYASTVDGGDRQFIMVQGMKVSTPNMPATAPWPKRNGTLSNSGNSYTADVEATNFRAGTVN
ncbi:MAG: hypothetical protein IV090_08575 [Candidatus Sericytochromatia bacterium]|nr:hypothetical protein [Candidatus Sericytochromatia bacterium]